MPVALCSEDWVCWLQSLGMRVLRLPTKIRDTMLASVNKILYLIVHCICTHLSYMRYSTNLTAAYKLISSNKSQTTYCKSAHIEFSRCCIKSSCTHEAARSHENLDVYRQLSYSNYQDIDLATVVVLIFPFLCCVYE